MVELVWSELENSTAGLEDGDATVNSTVATSTVWKNAVGQSVSPKVVLAVGIAVVSAAVFINSGVLANSLLIIIIIIITPESWLF